MKLPNAERAFVDSEKVTEYLLNSDHPRGKHKARVLQAACGFTIAHAGVLLQELLNAALNGDATPTLADNYGQRFMIEWSVTGPTGQAVLVTGWIVRREEDFPRFTSAYVR